MDSGSGCGKLGALLGALAALVTIIVFVTGKPSLPALTQAARAEDQAAAPRLPIPAPASAATTAPTVRPTEPPAAPPVPADTPAPRPDTTGSALTLQLAADVPLELVRVPAGPFLMGSDKTSDPEAGDDELPRQQVNLPEYWIGKYPVTVAQFAAFVQATGYQTTAERQGTGRALVGNAWVEVKGANWRQPGGPGSDVSARADWPVTQVSWDDAVAFGWWASQATAATVRLPTEAEWEKACRGTDGRLYPWGGAAPDATRANFGLNVGTTTPVEQYAAGAGPYGALDLDGNAWEWTSSLHKAYPYRAGDGREDLNDRGQRTLRGGSYSDGAERMRCAFRGWNVVDLRNDQVGFRVVASPSH